MAVTLTEMELPEIVAGAVYNPLAVIVPPPVANHVTLWSLVPETAAVNCWDVPTIRVVAAGDTVTWMAGCTPVPDRETKVGEVGALLAIVRVPDTLPAAVGEKTMETLVVAPGGRELRTEPLIEKFDPPEVMLALLMERAALPVFIISTICEAKLPTVTCPNETEDGLV